MLSVKSEKHSGPALWVIAINPQDGRDEVSATKFQYPGVIEVFILLYSPRIDIASVLCCLREARFCAVRDGSHGFLVGSIISEIKREGAVSVILSGDEYYDHDEDRDNSEEVW
jgi:hypothetical protein